MSRSFAVLVTFLTVFGPLARAHASSLAEMLVARPAQSLRGEDVDLDNAWSGARLLAHFGEDRLAYTLLKSRLPGDASDPEVERFEARLLTEINLAGRADSTLALQVYTGDVQAYYALCLQRARLNLQTGRCNRALGFLALVDSLAFPALEPYVDYVAMEAFLQDSSYDDAVRVGARRLAMGIPLSLSPAFEEHLLDAYLHAGRYTQAAEFLDRLKKRRTGAGELAPVLVREVDLRFEMGDTLGALEAAAHLTRAAATRDLAEEVAVNVVGRVPFERFDNRMLIDFSDILLDAGRLVEADGMLTLLEKRRLDAGQKEKRRLLMGTLLYQERRYSKSYDQVSRKFADPALERAAMILRARLYRKTGQPIRSANEYVAFATAYPYDGKAAEALYVAADLYLRSADAKSSLDILNRIIETYPSQRYGRIAITQMALYYIERKHYSRAVSILESALEHSGRDNPDLLYYLADCYRRMGKPEKSGKLLDEIETINPVSFYLHPTVEPGYRHPMIDSDGTIALDGERGLLVFLKDAFERREAAYKHIRAHLSAIADTPALDEGTIYLQRGRLFLQMGFRDWAEQELGTLESKNRLPARVSFELGVLYDDFAMHWKSVRAFQRVYYSLGPDARETLDADFKLLMHPLPYPALVLENCQRYNIPPHLVYAMMREESRFDHKAVSRAGAVGLMQLMPATGEQIAGELGFPEEVPKNLFRPEINLAIGIWYASHLLSRANDDPLMMLSAYNAGLGNARRWFTAGGDANASIAMVDGIDYRETRDYVKRIVESARIYHAYYFAPRSYGSGGSH